MNSNVVNVLIIGCGNIAGKFDELSTNKHPITHAGAYKNDSRFKLAACIDPDKLRRNEFMHKWDIPLGYKKINDIDIRNNKIDIISICSPTRCHYEDIKSAIKLRPKLIFCEKPLTSSILHTNEILDLCKKQNIHLCINYSRRWDLDIQDLKKEIINETRGALRSINGCYNKGLLNNGSHMLDLLVYLFDDLKIIHVGTPINDYFDDDPSIPVWLQTKTGSQILLNCSNASDFSFFELQFIFETGTLTMEDGGLLWRERKIVSSKLFSGYDVLDGGKYIDGNYDKSMELALDDIWNAIKDGNIVVSNGITALKTQAICEEIIEKINY